MVPCTVSPSGLTHSRPRVSSPCFRDAASTAAEEKNFVVLPAQNACQVSARIERGAKPQFLLENERARQPPASPRTALTAADGESPGDVVAKGQRSERLKAELGWRQRSKRNQGSRRRRSSGDSQQQRETCWPCWPTTHGRRAPCCGSASGVAAGAALARWPPRASGADTILQHGAIIPRYSSLLVYMNCHLLTY